MSSEQFFAQFELANSLDDETAYKESNRREQAGLVPVIRLFQVGETDVAQAFWTLTRWKVYESDSIGPHIRVESSGMCVRGLAVWRQNASVARFSSDVRVE